uniref:Uncharacterized protein n=1 Tax=Anguilla anguilla TaxID=7936 RepID=A0A0E9PAS5_ANGAN
MNMGGRGWVQCLYAEFVSFSWNLCNSKKQQKWFLSHLSNRSVLLFNYELLTSLAKTT